MAATSPPSTTLTGELLVLFAGFSEACLDDWGSCLRLGGDPADGAVCSSRM